MITRQGTHTCERCGKSYDWIARKRDNEIVIVGNFEDITSHNVQFFDIINGRLIATGCCPYCGGVQKTALVDEKV